MKNSTFDLGATHLIAALTIGFVTAFISASDSPELERRPEFLSRAQRAQLEAIDAEADEPQ
jgi:hypothetical protein